LRAAAIAAGVRVEKVNVLAFITCATALATGS
jgi:hypothetical protein